jgi:hypothetical protein
MALVSADSESFESFAKSSLRASMFLDKDSAMCVKAAEVKAMLQRLKGAGVWRLEGSAFWPRAETCDAMTLWDTRDVVEETFAADWKMLTKNSKFKKFITGEVLKARMRGFSMMMLGGVFEGEGKRGPPLNKIETRQLFTSMPPAKPVFPSLILDVYTAVGLLDPPDEAQKKGKRASSGRSSGSMRSGSSRKGGEANEEAKENSTLFFYKNSYQPSSPRMADVFVPSTVRASLSQSVDTKFAQQHVQQVIEGCKGDPEGSKVPIVNSLKRSFGESVGEDPNEITPKELNDILRTVKMSLYQSYKAITRLYDFYCSLGEGAGECTVLQRNGLEAFVKDMHLVDEESRGCQQEDVDSVLKACSTPTHVREQTFLPGKVDPKLEVYFRFEFMEVLTRIAVMKYMRDHHTDDVSIAVDLLFQKHLHSVIGDKKDCCTDRNLFRGCIKEPNVCPFTDLPNSKLYSQPMDRLFGRYYGLLECIYRRYKTKEKFDTYRSNLMELPQWMQLLRDSRIIGPRMNERTATLIYLRSRMQVVNQVEDYVKFKALTFTDFFEALARLADFMGFPDLQSLRAEGVSSSSFVLRQQQVSTGGIWTNFGGCVMTGYVKMKKGQNLAEPMETLLEHIVRVAGGDMHEYILPPLPVILDRQLRIRKHLAQQATKTLMQRIEAEEKAARDAVQEAEREAEAAEAAIQLAVVEKKAAKAAAKAAKA